MMRTFCRRQMAGRVLGFHQDHAQLSPRRFLRYFLPLPAASHHAGPSQRANGAPRYLPPPGRRLGGGLRLCPRVRGPVLL